MFYRKFDDGMKKLEFSEEMSLEKMLSFVKSFKEELLPEWNYITGSKIFSGLNNALVFFIKDKSLV